MTAATSYCKVVRQGYEEGPLGEVFVVQGEPAGVAVSVILGLYDQIGSREKKIPRSTLAN